MPSLPSATPPRAVPPSRRRARLLPPLVAAGAALALATAPAGAALDLVYAHAPGADAIYDAGLSGAVRQAPIFDEPRWPSSRQIAKLSGRELAGLTEAGMLASIRQAFARPGRNGMVAVDEVLPSRWTEERALALSRAMRMLGRDAQRVVFYASAALVAQVGRHDPRLELTPRNRALVDAMAHGRTFIEGYRSDLSALPPKSMATYLTRWWERVPADARGRLHVLLGPGDQAAIWASVRATPAGRAILRNGVGAYRVDTPAGGRAFVAAYRAFLADPDASPPEGDFPVPVGGGLSLAVDEGQEVRAGEPVRVEIGRPGNANLRLQLLPDGPTRVFLKLPDVTVGERSVRLPEDLRPGSYRLTLYLSGDGLEDRIERTVEVGGAAPATPDDGSSALRRRLIVNQRISQAAVRRLNAVQEWLDAGITSDDLAPASFGNLQFDTSVLLGPRPAAPAAPASPRPIRLAPAPAAGAVRVSVTRAQLLINQRISQAAVRRANALEDRLARGLTGGDILEGAITKEKLAPGTSVLATVPTVRPPASSTRVPSRPPKASPEGVRLTPAQLRINQRISQAAVRRANALMARLQAGISEELIRPGSLTSANLTTSLRR